MYFSYPKEYFFPVIMKDSFELNFSGEILEEKSLSRDGYLEENSCNRIFDEIDDEFIDNIIKKR